MIEASHSLVVSHMSGKNMAATVTVALAVLEAAHVSGMTPVVAPIEAVVLENADDVSGLMLV
jgi:hypothetical protein